MFIYLMIFFLGDVIDCSANPCHHGRCQNDLTGYNCICDQGYTGTKCDTGTVYISYAISLIGHVFVLSYLTYWCSVIKHCRQGYLAINGIKLIFNEHDTPVQISKQYTEFRFEETFIVFVVFLVRWIIKQFDIYYETSE